MKTDVAVQGTFIAKNLLDEKMYMNNISSNTDKAFDSRGYGPSDLRRWLQEKPFAGLSYAWKQTLSKSQVFSLEGLLKILKILLIQVIYIWKKMQKEF